LVVVDDLRVDHVVVVGRRLTAAARRATGGAGRLALGRLLVELLGELLAGVHQRLGARADLVHVVAVQRFLEIGEPRLDRALLVGRQLVALLADQLLGLVDEVLGPVAGLGLFAALAVLFGVGLGVLDHLADRVLAERGLTGDGHRLLLAR